MAGVWALFIVFPVFGSSPRMFERALNSLQAHAFSALQTIERTITDANHVLRGLSDSEIRADEARLSMRLKGIQDALPQMESIWAFEHAGWPLVSSTILPVLRDFSNADRDYFRAQVSGMRASYRRYRASACGHVAVLCRERSPARTAGWEL